MTDDYVDSAMLNARYEKLHDTDEYYGEITSYQGVWAVAKTLTKCKQELRETLKNWLVLRKRKGLHIPSINSITLLSAANNNAETHPTQVA